MPATQPPVIVGAVLYDPKVSLIWDIIRDFFEAQGVPMDVVFFTNYALQNDALFSGTLDIAWNSPLAWLDALRHSGVACRAIAMRDTDRDRVSHFVVPRTSPAANLADLRGKGVALGAKDSPQATLIPLGMLAAAGLKPDRDVAIRRHDLLVGKHGDHIGGEWEAFQTLARGEAAASAMLDLNWQAWTADGRIDASGFRVLASSPSFDHCVFTVRADFDPHRERAWLKALHAMDYANPKHREMMDMEGLKAWLPGRTGGFKALEAGLAASRYFEEGGR